MFAVVCRQDLDRGDFIAFSAAKPRTKPLPLPLRPPPAPSVAPTSSLAPMVPGSPLWPSALEFHLLSKASGPDGYGLVHFLFIIFVGHM